MHFVQFNAKSVVLGALLVAMPLMASESRTAADDDAFKEHIKATAQTDYIHQVFQQELMRISTGSNAPPSPDVAKLLNDSANGHADLGDLRIPLHLRLIQRELLTFASGIQLIRSTLGDCGLTSSIGQEQLFAADARQRELERIQCKRESRTRYLKGAHESNVAREKSILQLKLPPFTQQEMLGHQRSQTKYQDRDIEQKFALDDQTDRAAETFIRFLDTHSANMHLVKGQIQFDNDSDAGTANQLADKLFTLQNQKYPELLQR
jgi:hypothetical protein